MNFTLLLLKRINFLFCFENYIFNVSAESGTLTSKKTNNKWPKDLDWHEQANSALQLIVRNLFIFFFFQ